MPNTNFIYVENPDGTREKKIVSLKRAKKLIGEEVIIFFSGSIAYPKKPFTIYAKIINFFPDDFSFCVEVAEGGANYKAFGIKPREITIKNLINSFVNNNPL